MWQISPLFQRTPIKQQTLLTLDKPILLSLPICVIQWRALLHMIRVLVHHTILESHTENADNFIVDFFVPNELLVGFESANSVVFVAFIDGGNTTEPLVVPHSRFLVGNNNGFWKWRECK